MTKNREKIFVLLVSLLLPGGAALADSAVLTVVKGAAIVSQDTLQPWRKHDEACVKRDNKEIGCGIVTKLSGAKAVLRLFHPVKSDPQIGDLVVSKEKERDEEREVAASQPVPVTGTSLDGKDKPAAEIAKETQKVEKAIEKKMEKEIKKLLPFR